MGQENKIAIFGNNKLLPLVYKSSLAGIADLEISLFLYKDVFAQTKEHQYDLVVLDMILPEYMEDSEQDLLDVLITNLSDDIPVIVLLPVERQKFDELKILDKNKDRVTTISKPLDLKIFQDSVRKLLHRDG